MTELYELTPAEREERLHDMSYMELLVELDDAVQIDLCRMNDIEWKDCHDKKAYDAIINELCMRFVELEEGLPALLGIALAFDEIVNMGKELQKDLDELKEIVFAEEEKQE